MTLNLASILRTSALENPDKSAVTLGPVSLDYKTLHGYTQRFAGGLRELGVRQGSNIALFLPNVPHFSIAYFGGHCAGNPIVPLNVLLTADEIHYHLDDSEATAIVVWEGFYEQAKAAFDRSETCHHLILAKADPTDVSAPEGVTNMTALIGSSAPMTELTPTMPDDTAVILYTSGTTGRPKGAELTHFNMFYNSDYVGSRLMALDRDTVALVSLPLFHSFGQTCMHNAVLANGGSLVLLPRFDPLQAATLMVNHGVTFFGGVPTMYFALLNHPEVQKMPIGEKLKFCVSGGSAMPVEVMKSFDEKYGVDILEGYGLSETSPVASFNVLDRPKKPGSIGLPIRGCEFCLVDAEGARVTESDTPGEIWIKGHNVMRGYWNRAEATAEAITEGWFHTGDIGTRDDDGFYYIVDRKKDMIIRGGYNVYPREIEEVLYGHPAVTEAAVIGVPHESHGEEVKAVLAVRPGEEVDAEGIIAYCKERLAAYKYPRVVEFMDALPKGPTGKILKRELR